MDLAATIDRVKQGLASRRYKSESDVREAIVLPVLRALDWDDLDPERVIREHDLGGRRVDYALSALGKQPAVFIEVKGPSAIPGAERQLFEYAFHAGIPFAVLTNGQEWSFFLPAAPGSYEERLLYKLDLGERDTAEAARRLERYLGFGNVRSGEALRSARQDYDDIHSRRIVREELPRAWDELLSEPDAVLVDLLAGRVATLCGFPPAHEAVVAFLTERASPSHAARPSAPSLRARPQARSVVSASTPLAAVGQPVNADRAVAAEPMEAARFAPGPVAAEPEPAGSVVPGRLSYTFEGQTRTVRSAIEVLLNVVRTLAQRDPTFCERFAVEAAGRRRNHVAQRPEDVYPGSHSCLSMSSRSSRAGTSAPTSPTATRPDFSKPPARWRA